MKVRVDLKEWKISEDDKGEKRVTGTFSVKVGAMEMATQNFNVSYGGVPIPFSRDLLDAADALTEKIKKEIEVHFTGGGEE